MKKKLLALLLTVVLIVGLVPAEAFAAPATAPCPVDGCGKESIVLAWRDSCKLEYGYSVINCSEHKVQTVSFTELGDECHYENGYCLTCGQAQPKPEPEEKPVTVTNIVLKGDTVVADDANKTYTVTIPADAEEAVVEVYLYGTNLDQVPDEGIYKFSVDGQEYNFNNAWVEDGVFFAQIGVKNIGNHVAQYTTDCSITWTEIGWKVIVKKAETEPDPTPNPEPEVPEAPQVIPCVHCGHDANLLGGSPKKDNCHMDYRATYGCGSCRQMTFVDYPATGKHVFDDGKCINCNTPCECNVVDGVCTICGKLATYTVGLLESNRGVKIVSVNG